MRLYTFVNCYLSPFQHGVQTAHVVSELFAHYDSDWKWQEQRKRLWDWAKNHKTIIVLAGGDSATLAQTFEELSSRSGEFPIARFHEDERSLNGAMTAFGIILPERVYRTAALFRDLSRLRSSHHERFEDLKHVDVWEDPETGAPALFRMATPDDQGGAQAWISAKDGIISSAEVEIINILNRFPLA
jgi:hypothetical protein